MDVLSYNGAISQSPGYTPVGSYPTGAAGTPVAGPNGSASPMASGASPYVSGNAPVVAFVVIVLILLGARVAFEVGLKGES